MDYEMIEIRSVQLDEIQNNKLQEHVYRAHNSRSTEYIVFIDEIEAALLSYEDWSDRFEGFIYEIYVLEEYRKNGLGTKLLKFAENKARLLKCNKIFLEPRPLDKNVTSEFLVSWYGKQGYQKHSLDVDKMFKLI